MAEPLDKINAEKIHKQINEHENRIRLFKAEADRIDECILDSQILLGRHYPVCNRYSLLGDGVREQNVKQILDQQNTAAAVFCKLKMVNPDMASEIPFIKDVVGVVATLATVGNSNLSLMLSKFLGKESMLSIVCKTMESVHGFLKNCSPNGKDIHKIAEAIGMKIENRSHTICLEQLRSFPGKFVDGDPQRRLNIPRPRLPDGSCPSGFIDYAVNVIDLDSRHLSFVTDRGQGLRETLFYCLLSHVHVYSTKAEMLDAHRFITDGAFSLDGGMIKKSFTYILGKRKNPEVMFPVVSCKASKSAKSHKVIAENIRKLKWEGQNIGHDIRREEHLLEKLRRLIQGKEAKG